MLILGEDCLFTVQKYILADVAPVWAFYDVCTIYTLACTKVAYTRTTVFLQFCNLSVKPYCQVVFFLSKSLILKKSPYKKVLLCCFITFLSMYCSKIEDTN